MTRENRNLIINALIALLVSVVLVMSYAFIKTGGKGSIYDDLFGFETSVEEKVDINKGSIKAKQEIKNKDKDTVGAVYTLSVEGEYYDGKTGTVVIDLVIKNDKSILAYDFTEYGHTDGYKANVEELLDAIVKDNKKLSDLDPSDANGTGSTNTNTLILNAFIELNTYLDGGSEEPGENPSDKFRDKHIINEEKTADGYIFKLDTTEVSYGFGEGNIVIELTINKDLTIKSYRFVDYNHTEGESFKGQVEKLLNLFISEKVKLSEVKLSDDITGATNTSTVLVKMFKGLADYIEDVYGEGQEPEEPTFKEKHLLYQKEVLDKDKELTGYEFLLDTTDILYSDQTNGIGNVIIKITLDKELTFKDYEFVIYNHTGNDSKWQKYVKELLDSMKTNEVKLTEVTIDDFVAGATFTQKALLKMFMDLADYIKDGLVYDDNSEATFKDKHILYEKEILDKDKELTGYEFLLDTTDILYSDQTNGNGNVIIKITLDKDLTFKDYEFVIYNHTGNDSKWQKYVKELLDSMKTNEVKLTEVTIDDFVAGATLTQKALLKMFIDLVEYMGGE